MAETLKKLGQAQIGSAVSAHYTVPATTTTIIKHLRIVNPTVTAATVTLYHDGTTDAFMILPAATIEAGGWAEYDGVITMETGDTLQAKSGTDDVMTITVYGMEFS